MRGLLVKKSVCVLTSGAILASLLSGCASDNKNAAAGAAVGGILGTAACLALGVKPAACLAIGIATAAVGGLIGNSIDERDRQRRDEALRKALNDDIVWNKPVIPPQDVAPAAAPLSGDVKKTELAKKKTPDKKADTAQKAQPAANSAPPDAITWANPQTNNSGSIVPLRSYADSASNKVCREFEETYIRDGKQIVAKSKACKAPDGTWQVEDL